MSFTNTMVNLWNNMGFTTFTWQQGVMIGISLILLLSAIKILLFLHKKSVYLSRKLDLR